MGHNSTQQYGTLYYVPYSTVHYVQYKHNCQGCLIENQTDCRRNQLKLFMPKLRKNEFSVQGVMTIATFLSKSFLRSQFLLTLPIKIILPGFHCFWWLSIFSLQRVSKIDFENGVKSRYMEYGFQSQRSDHLDFKCNQHCIQKMFSRGQF